MPRESILFWGFHLTSKMLWLWYTCEIIFRLDASMLVCVSLSSPLLLFSEGELLLFQPPLFFLMLIFCIEALQWCSVGRQAAAACCFITAPPHLLSDESLLFTSSHSRHNQVKEPGTSGGPRVRPCPCKQEEDQGPRQTRFR